MRETCEAFSSAHRRPYRGPREPGGRWLLRGSAPSAQAARHRSAGRPSSPSARPRSKAGPRAAPSRARPERSSISPGRRSARGTAGAARAHPALTARASYSKRGAEPAYACRERRTRSRPSSRRCGSTRCAPATFSGGRGTLASMPATAGWSKRSTGATASSVAPRRARIARSVRPAERRAEGPPGPAKCQHRPLGPLPLGRLGRTGRAAGFVPCRKPKRPSAKRGLLC